MNNFYIQDDSFEIKEYDLNTLPVDDYQIRVTRLGKALDKTISYLLVKKLQRYLSQETVQIESIRDKNGVRTHDTVIMMKNPKDGKIHNLVVTNITVLGWEKVEVFVKRRDL